MSSEPIVTGIIPGYGKPGTEEFATAIGNRFKMFTDAIIDEIGEENYYRYCCYAVGTIVTEHEDVDRIIFLSSGEINNLRKLTIQMVRSIVDKHLEEGNAIKAFQVIQDIMNAAGNSEQSDIPE